MKSEKNKKERKKLIMNNKLPYEDAELEVVFFSSEDIVTLSLGDADSEENSEMEKGDGKWV